MAENWRQLSVLVAGCGSIGKRHARVLEGLGVEDVRACDPIPAAREALGADVPQVTLLDSYEAALRTRPDTVFVCTPPKMHVPMAVEAIQGGSHVFLEKPVSDSVEGVDELVALAAERQKKVMVGLCFRYHEGVVKLRDLLGSGRIGRLVSIRALMGEHLPDMRPDYKDLFSSKYCGAFDLMHDVDLALWLADQPVRRSHCLFGNYSDIGIEAPDLVELLIDFEDRCTASVHLDFFQRPRRRQLELIGTEGVAVLEFATWNQYTLSVYDVAQSCWSAEILGTDRDDMFRAEDEEFLSAVADDLPIQSTVEEGLRSLEVIMAAQRRG